MPLFRTDTGCRCRNTLVSMTTTRLRRSRGAGWRKMLFQTCELRMKSPTDMTVPSGEFGSRFHERIRITPLAQLFLELLALVDHELAVLADRECPALERARGRSFEVDAGDLEPAAVTGALE